MNKVTFDTDSCRGCSLCVEFCPKKIIKQDTQSLNVKGFNPMWIPDGDREKCIACAICAKMCPHSVIKVEKDD